MFPVSGFARSALDVVSQPREESRFMKTLLCFLIVLSPTLSVVAQSSDTSPSPSPTLTLSPSGMTSSTAAPSLGSSPAAATGQPSEAEMMSKMMELANLNENHKLLASLAGSWTYTIQMSMAPGAPPMKSTGIAVRKPLMNGRYFTLDVTGKMKMPGSDGKLKDFEFKGMSIEGYDNVKQKFVSAWVDNMGTGIMFSEGTYDPSSKSFTYTAEMEPVPGMKTKAREVIKVVDKDHHIFEWYEDRGGQEVKTMEINYTRKK
jgi:Protein of unknown function (DUF1579)